MTVVATLTTLYSTMILFFIRKNMIVPRLNPTHLLIKPKKLVESTAP